MIEFTRINKYCVLECHFNELGQVHREDGPAKIYWHYMEDDLENCQTGKINKKEYFLNGKHFNKNNGPIIIKYSNGNVSYKEFSNNEKGLKSIVY